LFLFFLPNNKDLEHKFDDKRKRGIKGPLGPNPKQRYCFLIFALVRKSINDPIALVEGPLTRVEGQ
jgi:hypothetical protein